MVLENFYSKSMSVKSDTELQNYINHNADYQEDAVLAAIWELENRGFSDDNLIAIKTKLEAHEKTEPIQSKSIDIENIELYSFNFIILFGILFSVFAASILIGLNLTQLKNKSKSRLVVFSGLAYSLLQVYLMGALKLTSPFISVLTSFLGVFLLYHYFIKSELNPDTTYQTRSPWQPLLIGFLISLPIAYFVVKSMATAL